MAAEFGKDPLKIAAYMFAGLSMMLNIRLVYSAAPFALLRFKLPENLFSVFVRIMAGSLELWCLPSMTIGNVMDYARKAEIYVTGGDQGHLTAFYWVIAASGFVFGIYMVMVYAMEFQYLAWYMIGENSFPMVTSFMHYVGTLFFGNRRKWNSDFIIVMIDIVISLAISLVAAVIWTIAYKTKSTEKHPSVSYHKKCINKLELKPADTGSKEYNISTESDFAENHATDCGYKKSDPVNYYGHLVPPALMVLVGMGLVYSIYPGIAPGMIVPFYLIDKIEMVLLIATAFPPVIIGILKKNGIDPYVFMGYWGGKHDAVTATGDLTLTPAASGNYNTGTTYTITLNITAATYKTGTTTDEQPLGLSGNSTLVLTSTTDIKDSNTHNLTRKANGLNLTLTAEDAGVTTALNGKTYNVSLKIESDINLNGSTCSDCKLKQTVDSTGKQTPVSLGTYNITSGAGNTNFTGTPDDANDLHSRHQNTNCCIFGSQNTWTPKYAMYTWHAFTILAPFQICLAGIFIHCLHYPDSSIARSIVNQPKMSTFLSIIFYMCHEIMLAMGFPGIATDDNILLPMQLIGAYIMVLLAYYSVGYITEYKRHEPSQWPTDGMTKWNALCYWLKMASKNTNKNLTWNFHLLSHDLYPLILEGLLFYNILDSIYHIEIKHIIPHVLYKSIHNSI